jgi:hypothetical protein
VPDAAFPTPGTASHYNANVRQQVISQLNAGSISAGTEGRVYAVLDQDRLGIDNGSVILPGPNWGTAGRVGFRLTDSTNRSIPNTSTWTSLTFATEVNDDAFFAAPGTTATIPTDRGGLYLGYATFTWASSPGTNSGARLLVSGAIAKHVVPLDPGTNTLTQTLYILGSFAQGDTLQIQLIHAAGGSINVNPTEWEMYRLCA